MIIYRGIKADLIELLESLSVVCDESHDEAFRFPVRLVARHNGHEANDFHMLYGRSQRID